MRVVGGGRCGVSTNEYSCAHRVQINFGDLTPYLTYVVRPLLCTARRVNWHHCLTNSISLLPQLLLTLQLPTADMHTKTDSDNFRALSLTINIRLGLSLPHSLYKRKTERE